MENVQAISFNQEMVEAGSARLRPEEAQTIQKDQLEPKVMQGFGGLIAYATMDGIVTYMGALLTKVHYSFIEKELGWLLPAHLTNEVEERDGEEKEGSPDDPGGEEEQPEEEAGDTGDGGDAEGSEDPEPEGTPESPEEDGEEGGGDPVAEDDDFVPDGVEAPPEEPKKEEPKSKGKKGKKKKGGKK